MCSKFMVLLMGQLDDNACAYQWTIRMVPASLLSHLHVLIHAGRIKSLPPCIGAHNVLESDIVASQDWVTASS